MSQIVFEGSMADFLVDNKLSKYRKAFILDSGYESMTDLLDTDKLPLQEKFKIEKEGHRTRFLRCLREYIARKDARASAPSNADTISGVLPAPSPPALPSAAAASAAETAENSAGSDSQPQPKVCDVYFVSAFNLG
jgi:hypothetical protein